MLAPPAGSVWIYVKKFEASLARMRLLDLDTFLRHAEPGDTCSNAVAALLSEPSRVEAPFRKLRAHRKEEKCCPHTTGAAGRNP